jgi:starch phosphorylase
MKLALNGALTIGTWDGANIEMGQAIGEQHMFVFGLRADAVVRLRAEGYKPRQHVDNDPALHKALEAIGGGAFSPDEPARYRGLIDGLLTHDTYMVLADFADYLAAQRRVDALYRQHAAWTAAVCHNIAAMGRFSVDRTVREYAHKVWLVPAQG